jgi:hypothetical protein
MSVSEAVSASSTDCLLLNAYAQVLHTFRVYQADLVEAGLQVLAVYRYLAHFPGGQVGLQQRPNRSPMPNCFHTSCAARAET